jgi:hypothetical protein
MPVTVIDTVTVGTLTVDLLSTGHVRFTQNGESFELWSDVKQRRSIFDAIKASGA